MKHRKSKYEHLPEEVECSACNGTGLFMSDHLCYFCDGEGKRHPRKEAEMQHENDKALVYIFLTVMLLSFIAALILMPILHTHGVSL